MFGTMRRAAQHSAGKRGDSIININDIIFCNYHVAFNQTENVNEFFN